MDPKRLGILYPPELDLYEVCATAGVALPPRRRTSDLTDAEIEAAFDAAFPDPAETCATCGEPNIHHGCATCGQTCCSACWVNGKHDGCERDRS